MNQSDKTELTRRCLFQSLEAAAGLAGAGPCSRIAVCWHIADGETERGQFYGDRMSYIMARPEKSPNTVITIRKDGKTVLDANGYPEGKAGIEACNLPNHVEMLPESMRVKSGHGGVGAAHIQVAHPFLPEQPGGVPQTNAGIARPRLLLGIAPSSSFDPGLKCFSEWLPALR